MQDNLNISLSAIDEKRFGITTAKASDLNSENLDEAISFCVQNSVQLFIVRCDAAQIRTVHALESSGFLLMDTLVYYALDINHIISTDMHTDSQIKILSATGNEYAGEVKSIATNGFSNFIGHYHADPRLDKEKCNEVYADWAYNSCVYSDVADEVLIAEVADMPCGFLTIKKHGKIAEFPLNAVSKDFQRRGIFNQLILHGIDYCIREGIKSIYTSTQINNLAPQKVWIRNHFEPQKYVYTFHKWF